MRVHLDSLGCRLNQSEIEHMGRQFRLAGNVLVASPEQSDLLVINTCAVTRDAAAASRARIRSAHRRSPDARIIVTGCWSTLEPEEALALSGVDQAIPNAEKDRLVQHLLGIPIERFDLEPVARQPLPGPRTRTRAFVKAQDGCDHHCTYCLTTLARGPAVSLPVQHVVEQVVAAVAGGAQEVVISGVQLSSYGSDFDEAHTLTDLARTILTHTDIQRVRFSSLEPWGLPDDFLNLWQDRRMCRQLHLPLQSGSPATLKRMGRPIRPEAFARLLERARSAVADMAITTDLIAGFPGETDADFNQSVRFVQKMGFTDAHVFPYSPRPGTGAAKLPTRVDPHVAKARALRLRQVVAATAEAYRTPFVGRRLHVLWEAAERIGPDGWTLSGWSDNYIRVSALAPTNLWNQICNVMIDRSTPDGLAGHLV